MTKLSKEEFLDMARQLALENSSLQEAVERSVDPLKFYTAPLSVEMVAVMHGVGNDRVLKYINLGLIELHPRSTEHKFFVRGSDALTLDFKSLMRRSKKLIYGNKE